ncbi:MAG: type II toxin-antitoxin system RelE/ParE family toxin [bacterium]
MKIKDIIVLKEVSDNLNNRKLFYDQKKAGIGDYFWDSLVADIESLIIYGGLQHKSFGLRRMFAKRFPYAIYYEIKDDNARIIAVLPMRSAPVWIKKKLKERN